MAVIKLVEDYAVSQLRKDVRDAMTLGGEQSVVLQLFHSGDKDAVPCPQCGDDIYQSPEVNCKSCYGTMFDGGVRAAMKVWAIYTDHDVAEQIGPRGTWQPDQRSVTFEAFPMVTEHDILVRITGWNADGTAEALEGFYMLQKLQRRSLRTGTRFGQANWDVVSQKAQVSELNANSTGISRYPIVGKVFEESIQLNAPVGNILASATMEPDVKVVYFPFEVAPGGITPGDSFENAFVYTQQYAASVWIIAHTLGGQPTVSVAVGGEEVEGEVDYPDASTVVITFTTPLAGTARLT